MSLSTTALQCSEDAEIKRSAPWWDLCDNGERERIWLKFYSLKMSTTEAGRGRSWWQLTVEWEFDSPMKLSLGKPYQWCLTLCCPEFKLVNQTIWVKFSLNLQLPISCAVKIWSSKYSLKEKVIRMPVSESETLETFTQNEEPQRKLHIIMTHT